MGEVCAVISLILLFLLVAFVFVFGFWMEHDMVDLIQVLKEIRDRLGKPKGDETNKPDSKNP